MTRAFFNAVAADRYDTALPALVPLDEPENIRKLRKRLMMARDLSSVALSNPGSHTDQSLALYNVILDVSAAHVARLQDLAGLEEAANLCLRLLNSASNLDRMGASHVQ